MNPFSSYSHLSLSLPHSLTRYHARNRQQKIWVQSMNPFSSYSHLSIYLSLTHSISLSHSLTLSYSLTHLLSCKESITKNLSPIHESVLELFTFTYISLSHSLDISLSHSLILSLSFTQNSLTYSLKVFHNNVKYQTFIMFHFPSCSSHFKTFFVN